MSDRPSYTSSPTTFQSILGTGCMDFCIDRLNCHQLPLDASGKLNLIFEGIESL